MGKRKK